MSARLEQIQRTASLATPGEVFRILAPSASLRKHLTDSYWSDVMEEVCDGKLEGVAVRYTGDNLVLLQFRPPKLSPAGYRYPLYISIPIEFMVPVGGIGVNVNVSDLHGSFGMRTNSSFLSNVSSNEGKAPAGSAGMPKLCIVCGKYNVPGMRWRSHGWKCKECKGKKSTPQLRLEAQRLQAQMKQQ